MGLIILTTLMCLAHLSAARCPEYRPLTASQSCSTNKDCPSGRSCCAYSDSKFCVSTDPNTCISDGEILKKGDSITLKDNCSTCYCHGYDDLICTNDGCVWPKTRPAPGPICPVMKPSSANTKCTMFSSCSSGYTCCKYLEGSFCTLADPNSCYSEGKKIHRGKMVTLKDGCSECECQGHDSFLCTNDGCVWPKPSTDHGCSYGGIYRKSGSSFPATDGCNTCVCEYKQVFCTYVYCTKLPFKSLGPKKKNLQVKKG